jgi:hypothetical protein
MRSKKMINGRVRKLIDAVYDMIHGDTPVGPRLTKLKETYDEVRFYDIYPSVAYQIVREDKHPPYHTSTFGVVLDDRERAQEVLRKEKLTDALEAYNNCELHDDEYDDEYRWFLRTEEIK